MQLWKLHESSQENLTAVLKGMGLVCLLGETRTFGGRAAKRRVRSPAISGRAAKRRERTATGGEQLSCICCASSVIVGEPRSGECVLLQSAGEPRSGECVLQRVAASLFCTLCEPRSGESPLHQEAKGRSMGRAECESRLWPVLLASK